MKFWDIRSANNITSSLTTVLMKSWLTCRFLVNLIVLGIKIFYYNTLSWCSTVIEDCLAFSDQNWCKYKTKSNGQISEALLKTQVPATLTKCQMFSCSDMFESLPFVTTHFFLTKLICQLWVSADVKACFIFKK